MPELPGPRSLEEWASRCVHKPLSIKTESWPDDLLCRDCARAYAEQEVAKVVSEFNADLLAGAERENELHNEKDAKITTLQAERDTLLVVAQALENLCEQSQYQMDRLHQELQERPNYKDVTWDYANDLVVRIKAAVKASIHDAEVPLNHPDVQRLVKEDL